MIGIVDILSIHLSVEGRGVKGSVPHWQGGNGAAIS